MFFKKRKMNNFPPLRSFSAQKIVAFVVFALLVGFGLVYVFVSSRFFRKKNKLARNCLDNLIYYTTHVVMQTI